MVFKVFRNLRVTDSYISYISYIYIYIYIHIYIYIYVKQDIFKKQDTVKKTWLWPNYDTTRIGMRKKIEKTPFQEAVEINNAQNVDNEHTDTSKSNIPESSAN